MINYHIYPTFPIYNRYVGRHMYKFSRKYLGKSKLLALELADLPASVLLGGLVGLITQNVGNGIALAVGHQITTPIWLYSRHRKNVKERAGSRVLFD